MDTWIALVVVVVASGFVGWLARRRTLEESKIAEKKRADALRADFEQQKLIHKQELELQFKARQAEIEHSAALEKAELRRKEEDVQSARQKTLEEREELEKKRALLDQRISAAEEREDAARDRIGEYRERLHTISNLSTESAREELRKEVEIECEDEMRDLREERLKRSIDEVDDEARNILIAAIQRLSAQPQNDITATIVKLPSEDMKGRIIGREGRNIKAFESTTGTTILIDETPGTVLISSFDAVRREIARITLESLLSDGRIHPATIEEAAAKAEDEVQRSVIAYGENAVQRLRLTKINPEVITALGRMHFRLANNQNTLAHSIEVANLSALLAAELGLDSNLAKRCGLFHDIGKVLNEEYPSSHAMAGALFLKQHGNEDPRVLNAVAAHHGEVPAESPYVGLLISADRLSSMRPGARAESMDGYIQRVRSLEDIALATEGVKEAYALQAGREIRVIVDPGAVDDLAARRLATRIRRQVEDELQYPGTIKITVIRESRISETAK